MGTPPSEPIMECTRDFMDGIPMIVHRPNRPYMSTVNAQRAGLTLRYDGNRFAPEQSGTLWFSAEGRTRSPVFLSGRESLAVGDTLLVLDDAVHDLGIGVPMLRVQRGSTRTEGYVTLHTAVGECSTLGEPQLWTEIANPEGLRAAIGFEGEAGVLYSTNRMHAAEVAETRRYLMAFDATAEDRPKSDIHPLQAGAHAHRMGVWALDRNRTHGVRQRVGSMLEAMFRHYVIPAACAMEQGQAWPYTYDFSMPWGTILKAPWYSGYSNSAMAGAAACAFALTGNETYRSLCLAAVDFLRVPAIRGGPLYHIDGHAYVAEYCYRSPPVPNYRVLDGELCSVVYLYNAAVLLGDHTILELAIQLGEGLRAALPLFCADGGLPVFGMDGQPMNPNYMWQIWATLHILANIFKDRAFLQYAAPWRSRVPRLFAEQKYPM